MLGRLHGLRTVAIFEEIRRCHSDLPPGVRRTLESSLRKKPMALLNSGYRDQLFPRPAYKRVFDESLKKGSEMAACRAVVTLLALALDRACEGELADEIDAALNAGKMADLQRLRAQFDLNSTVIPDVVVMKPCLCL